jgi:AcrR family transcriptional regulator
MSREQLIDEQRNNGRTRPRRLTQQERSAATRLALIDATIESLVELGYERTTTVEVSERAGLSRGAHLHHFQTRAALISAAVKALAERGTEDLQAAVGKLPEGGGRIEAALDLVWESIRGPLFQVVLELSVHARTDAWLRGELDPIEAMVKDASRRWLRIAFTGDASDPTLDRQIGIITAAVRGLAMLPLLEPSLRIDRRWKVFRSELLDLITRRLNDL